MSKIEELIEKLCPNGVEWKELGELGNFFSGLNGKSKKDFENGNEKFITYMNVFSNLELDTDIVDKVFISENEKQNSLSCGDIIFTGSSEIREECGMSSVLIKQTFEKLFLNSFCFGFRFYDGNIMLPKFSKYLFRSNFMRKQIIKTSSGVTRFNVSREKMKQIKTPIPPLEIQEEIVHILDSFTELTAELTARRKQYEFYRDSLLTFGDEVEWKELGEVCNNVCSGGTPPSGKSDYYGGEIPWLRTQEINFNDIHDTEIKITELGLKNSSAKYIHKNCVIIAMYGATVGKVAINKIPLTTNQACCNLEINGDIAVYRYVFYWLSNQYGYIKSLGQGSQTNINSKIVKQLIIPIPPLSEQERIVSILDKFDKLCNDISEGLPAEIEARKKQYEYYRDKLLNFEELKKS
ncbi:Putative type I restriction enzyme (Specificity subunit) [Candidatus Arthromitus sp. SFB-mouse-SU]|nr:Putative type I restriction enzyme [Candidatus Arthromitus sp. SFB-2]EIA24070.1 Putative type I restriction enzyme (Specificity subunit) [Candidatus Arthromitus sp. SFB-1]EIA25346.1 Putative type I restriction enzyme [Candidatus Arthromitus sp. SFB-4]EIA28339.1 Putative type I restriction enzyme (Specificity subunit) [Candidatus Arthromitus sp. SFB-co]EIA29915.1 Putative type I restriction enzyme (Specificity subunit) [Candidatus Arthromitus sp. SFB-mouse-SU]EIA31657.1 Putative type I restr